MSMYPQGTWLCALTEPALDGGAVTSDAGTLLLGATDRAIGRFAGCFTDGRRSELIEHEVATLVGQRVFGIALSYEDLNDQGVLRHARRWRFWSASSTRSARHDVVLSAQHEES